MQDRSNLTVLLVHEDGEQARAVQQAARTLQYMKEMLLVQGVQELTAYLDRCHPPFTGDAQPCPNLILFDLQASLAGARDVLARLKRDEVFKPIPVVVLARNEVSSEYADTYDLGINAFVRRPDDPEELARTLRIIENFWLGVATLPHAERRSF